MKSDQNKRLHKSSLCLLIVCMLTSFLAYAKKPSKAIYNFENSWLNDFKCAIEIGSGIPFLKHSGFYLPINGGICLGYSFFKYNHTQLGEWESSGRTVTVDAGEGKFALEVGIRFPEQHKHEDYAGFQIVKKFFVFPISIKWSEPDAFSKITTAYFLGYTPKYLMSAQYKITDPSKDLPSSFQQDIKDLKKAFSDVKTFSHSAFIGASLIFPIGLYFSGAISVPLEKVTTSAAENEKRLDQQTLNGEYINQHTKGSLDDLLSVTIGLDMISLYKYIHKDDFI